MSMLICFGTRPEAIKMALLCKEFEKKQVPFKICVTAQHREMLDQVLNFFQLKPDYDLDLMKPDQSLNNLSARILEGIDSVLNKEKFDLVLVQGDTTTAAMVALAAFNNQCKIGHIEAGLRTYNKQNPFPEEVNRQIISRIADYHFAPTQDAKNNLLQEKISENNILVTGNTVIDALQWTLEQVKSSSFTSVEIKTLKEKIDFRKKVVLVTGHRRENFGSGLENVCKALLRIAEKDVEIIFPVHLNPEVQKCVSGLLSKKSNIHLTAPLPYPSFVWLMSRANLIISDSGGIQEEAPTLGVPVIVTRKTSEREEGLKAGYSRLAGTNIDLICKYTEEILNKQKQDCIENPYGDGKASKRIVEFIISNC